MKKLFLALFAAMMIFSFCACGNSETTNLDPADVPQTEDGSVASDGSLIPDPDEPRYTSDGELIVEEEVPASDSDLKTE